VAVPMITAAGAEQESADMETDPRRAFGRTGAGRALERYTTRGRCTRIDMFV